MIKFLHTADIHLDSPLCGLERYDGAPVNELRCATREALRNLVELAISEQVNFLLIAGDLYDGDWKDYNTGLFFAKEMSRLREADVRVYVVFGNHDAASQITKKLGSIPSNVHHFSSKKPKTEIMEDIGVAIHGRSFPKRAVTEDISTAYPEARPGYFNIGILHTSLTGREGHEPYAPCTIDGLVSKNYHYWALGHVHKREVVHEDPWIIFPGNIQGRHIRETGAKGCTLVTVEDNESVLVEHRDLDVLRWQVCNVDASGAESPEEIIERVNIEIKRKIDDSESRLLALRVSISGNCTAHEEILANPEKWTSEIRAASTDESGGRVWIEKVKVNTRAPIDLEKMAERNDPVGDLLRFIQEIDSSLVDIGEPVGDIIEITKQLSDDFAKLKTKLPTEIRQDSDLDMKNPDTFHRILEDAKQVLVSRLLSKGGLW
ncbi:MAG: hypothetical protein BA872_08865 [Desulfobacterales bacterium C00003060]|nr:MAG: hypothetical protein BA861_08495 [Desulfobacterales bacterium S3730MH5]OEU78429.1 MAG: hypothetical protein BA865_15755 [Desulfobacterales bacterium S5133MH4]OEU78648.1 MAG: hypothetical protein BA872_08865 [Desulfobacterales bacterium C00003060]